MQAERRHNMKHCRETSLDDVMPCMAYAEKNQCLKLRGREDGNGKREGLTAPVNPSLFFATVIQPQATVPPAASILALAVFMCMIGAGARCP